MGHVQSSSISDRGEGTKTQHLHPRKEIEYDVCQSSQCSAWLRPVAEPVELEMVQSERYSSMIQAKGKPLERILDNVTIIKRDV